MAAKQGKVKKIGDMTPKEIWENFRAAKKAISENTVARNLIKKAYEGLVETSGNVLPLFKDESGEAHGFKREPNTPRVNMDKLEKALLARGITPEQIVKIKEESKGAMGFTFTDF